MKECPILSEVLEKIRGQMKHEKQIEDARQRTIRFGNHADLQEYLRLRKGGD